MGLFSSIKSGFKSAIHAIKKAGSSAVHKAETIIVHTASGVKNIASKASKLAGQAAQKAGSLAAEGFATFRDFVQFPMKTLANLFQSPTFLIALGIGAVALVIILPKVIK